jgi:hypothetical protein
MASKLGCWTLEDVQPQGRHSFLKFSLATPHFSPELKSLQVSGSLGEERGDRSRSILWIWWRRMECIAVRGTATRISPGVFESAYRPRRSRKDYCLIRAHILTVLSVTKPRPRPMNVADATHWSALRLSWIWFNPHLSSPNYETKWDKESRVSEFEYYFLSPFLPAHEDLRAIASCGEHGRTNLYVGTKKFVTSTI